MPTLNTKALRARLSATLRLEEAVNDLGDLYLIKHTTVEQDDLIDGIYTLLHDAQQHLADLRLEVNR